MTIPELISKVGRTYKDGSSLAPGYLYHPLPFPEYAGYPVHKTQCIEEWEAIQQHYDFTGKTVVDIGCNVGYFTFNIAKTAEKVIGYEADDAVRAVAEVVRQEQGIDNVEFRASFTKELVPDVYLWLNSHMWLVKQLGYDLVQEMLNDMSGCDLIFQTAHAESRGMYLVKELRDLADIVQYLKDCGFPDPKHIHTTLHDGFPRYMVMA